MCLMTCSSFYFIFQDCRKGHRALESLRVSIKKNKIPRVHISASTNRDPGSITHPEGRSHTRHVTDSAMGTAHSEPICQAAYNGELHQVHQLLKADIKNLNVQDELLGDTPLIAACKGGNVSVVKYLLDRKADVSIRNKKQRTCLHYVAKRTFSFLDYLMIIILMPILLIGYLILNNKQRQNVQLLEMVLNSKADINAVDHKGNTALHYACQCKSHKLIPLLLGVKADIGKRNKDGETPLDIAIRLKFKKIVAMMEKSQ